MSQAKLYAELAAFPSNTAGWLSENGTATVIHSQRDIERNETRTFTTTHVRSSPSIYEQIGFPVDLVNVKLISVSPSGKYVAMVRALETGGRDHAHLTSLKDYEKEKAKFAIELWDKTHMTQSVLTENKHAGVYADGIFGSQHICLGY